ncbi:MAG: OmpA family protein [Ketobacteraceae bacterium]|nr:OmpA family protein [Ketobacteraceae bacterium]
MKKVLLASTIAALGVTSLPASAEKGQVYINPAVGYMTFDSDRSLDDTGLGALGLEYQFHEHWGVEILGLSGNPDHDVVGDIDLEAYRLDGLFYLGNMGKLKPYLAAGVGKAQFEFSFDDYEEDQYNLGGGVRYLINNAISARADLRAVHGDDNSTWDALATIGLSYAFGGSSKPAPAPAPEPVAEPEPAPAPAPTKPVPPTPADSDNDGVFDDKDQCPNTPEGVKVDANGCPLDSDKDGVPNYLDKCLDSAPDARVDSKGCDLKRVRVDEIKLKVQFASNSSIVPESAMSEIKKVADFMGRHKDLVVEIEGHTDSMGKASYNKFLSQRRADAVAKVLVDKFGIDSGRVKATGYGEEKPVASNETAEGRQENRRVVAVLQKEVEE